MKGKEIGRAHVCKEIKEALTQKSIFHCAMDDFYMENAKDLQNIVLKLFVFFS